MHKTVNGVIYKSIKTKGIPSHYDRDNDNAGYYSCPLSGCAGIVVLYKRFESYAFPIIHGQERGIPVYIDADTILTFCSNDCRELYLLAPILLEIEK